MLNIVKLVESINDVRSTSMNSAVLESIEEYSFGGMDTVSALMEANTVMASDMADIVEFSVNTDELMVEAVSSNPDRLYVLTENIGKSFLDAIKNFFLKAAGIAKGIFNRIGVALTQLTGRIDKWSVAMKSKIEAAKKDPKKSGFKYNIWQYRRQFITDKLYEISQDIGKDYIEIDKIDSIVKSHVEKLKNASIGDDGNITDTDGRVVNDAVNKTASDDMDNNLLKVVKDAFDSKYDSTRGPKVNIESIRDLGKSLRTAMYGEKKFDLLVASDTTGMLKAIEDSKNTLKRLKTDYGKHASALQAAANALTEASRKFDFDNKDGGNVSAAVATVKKSLENDAKMVKGYLSVINTITASNIKAVKDMTTDYMMALTAFVGGVKMPKEDKNASKEGTDTKPEGGNEEKPEETPAE